MEDKVGKMLPEVWIFANLVLYAATMKLPMNSAEMKREYSNTQSEDGAQGGIFHFNWLGKENLKEKLNHHI